MASRQTFDSWKAIAAYLNRSVRTCRIWEHRIGLPVHRLKGFPKARVFAYRSEIDEWLETRTLECPALSTLRGGPATPKRKPKGRNVLLAILAILLGAGILILFLV
jgi:hypothetical protein